MLHYINKLLNYMLYYLFQTLPNDLKWEFPRHQLKIKDMLGEGCFGQVWKYEAENVDGIEGETIYSFWSPD